MTPVARHNRPKNPRRISELGALRVLHPEQWERKIRRAMEKSGGSVPDAAAELEISLRQMFRILALEQFADVERAPVGSPAGRNK